jgi:hypothetical protein
MALRSVPVSARPTSPTLAIQVPSAFIGPDTSEVDVTLTRSSPAGAAAQRKPLTVSFSESYSPIPVDGPGGHTIVSNPGVNECVTFRPGQAGVRSTGLPRQRLT